MKTYDIQAQTRNGQATAVSRAALRVSEIGPWLGRTYGSVASVVAAQGAALAGPPFARYHRLADDRFAVEAGFPVTAAIHAEGDVQPSELPGGLAASTIHTGSYQAMAPAYEALVSWVTHHDGAPAGDPWETYLSDPAREPDPATWRTEITQPYRPA